MDRNTQVLSITNVLHVRCLGAFAYRASGEWCGGPAFKSGRELLQYLVSYHHLAVPRETLADAFWPDLDGDSVIHRLHLAVSGARAALKSLFPRLDAIQCRGGSYALHSDIVVASDMDALFSASRNATMAEMEAAVAASNGEYMAGERAEWMYPLRVRCAQAFLSILERLADAAEESGDVDKALDYALRLVEIDRAHEAAARRLMRLLVRCGRRGAALNEFDELARYLKRHLAIEPSAQTKALRDAIAQSAIVV
ncbi:MAG: bacterial transcriptional activator domain-containing protein [Candidatus Eremiobacteraeota bacterium]|nr:bacterial transcriptional activator domain-containing protein [Candidatus Eremiobacteraeota bacterium]